jgi:uncharacterized membrane protein YozB (DUF420 family)
MVNSLLKNTHRRTALNRATRWVLITAITAFVSYIAYNAAVSTFSNEDFPESLAVKVELMPFIFPLHMITGALALLLLPLAYSLRHTSKWHRPVGRITAIDVLISGVTAYPVALIAPVTFWSAAGFSAQATIWLVLLAMGIYNIRRGRVAAHRACMLLMAATTSGAIVFRVFLALWAQYGSFRYFDEFYAVDSWIAWMIPLALCAFLLMRGGGMVNWKAHSREGN